MRGHGVLIQPHQPFQKQARDSYYAGDGAVHERGRMNRGVRARPVEKHGDRTVRGAFRCNSARNVPVPLRGAMRFCAGTRDVLASTYNHYGIMDTNVFLEQVTFDPNGLVPALAQDHETGEVLMLAWMNRDTLHRTLRGGVMTYWSRSRQEVWVKGQSSGHIQEVVEIRIDCDGDALLFKVKQHGGGACHVGYRSCFYRRYDDERLITDGERVFDPEVAYDRGS